MATSRAGKNLAQKLAKLAKKIIAPASVVTYQNPDEMGEKKTYTLRGTVGKRTPPISSSTPPYNYKGSKSVK